MTAFMSLLTVTAILATDIAETGPVNEQSIQSPSLQVIAMYFYRTQRCPTCKRIGALAEEAIRNRFAEELKTRAVEFRLADFQDEKNFPLVKNYEISTPTLVLINVFDGKAISWEPMPKIWQLVGEPGAFQAYVQNGVTKYLKLTRKEAESKE